MALGNEAPDPAYDKFLLRIRRGGADQVLRYCRWPTPDDIAGGAGPLTISSHCGVSDPLVDVSCDPVDSAGVASMNSCPRCRAPRKFEFQVIFFSGSS
jgi:hypothetical protein